MDYIFFDFDGTLVDTSEGVVKCLKYSMDFMNFIPAPDADLTEFLGPPLPDKFAEYCNFSPEDTKKAVAKFRERYNDIGVFESVLYDGIAQTLEKLQNAGKTLCVATSKPEWQARRLAQKYGIAKYFFEITGSSLDGKISTKEQVICELFKRIGNQPPENVLMVGDRRFDVEGAKEFGVATLGVTYGFGSRQELEKAGAKYVVDTTAEISDLILNKI